MLRLMQLLGGCAVFWVLAAFGWQALMDDEWAVLFSGTAMGLCVVPATISLAWATWTARTDPQQVLLVVLGGSGLRMFGVLCVAFVLYWNVPPYQGEFRFLVWLIVCYLFTLALEISLVLRVRSGSDKPA